LKERQKETFKVERNSNSFSSVGGRCWLFLHLVGNLDGERSSFEFLSVEFESSLLFFVGSEIDETESFGSSISSHCNVSLADLVSSEDLLESLVVNGEREVGDIEESRRWVLLLIRISSWLSWCSGISGVSAVVAATATTAAISSLSSSVISSWSRSSSSGNLDGDDTSVDLRLVKSLKSSLLILSIAELDESESEASSSWSSGCNVGCLCVELIEDGFEISVFNIERKVGDVEGVFCTRNCLSSNSDGGLDSSSLVGADGSSWRSLRSASSSSSSCSVGAS